ncbi:hypothetical protein QYM36_007207 [Artemia franciscana]|uniref:Reverse transcriptase domain-containing protein n=1 Tax=Artemia franciscana TaxID=6661 RepID=A0AA88LD15_ARTSF|nr:hypothetical protein QYM36_007207 [Artemia franciscana]
MGKCDGHGPEERWKRTPLYQTAISNLDRAAYFSRLYVRLGYWILQLSQKASYLTTFSTIYGHYRWKRYPFGLSSTQYVFQQSIEQALDGLKGLCILVGDLLIYGRIHKEHDESLRKVLHWARKLVIKFNKIKCQLEWKN